MKAILAVAVCLALISSAGLCFAQTQLVNDNFDTGANGTYLGPNWMGCGYYGGSYTELVYQNNQAGGAGYYTQDCAVYTGYGAFPSDQYATATVGAPNPSGVKQAGVQLRQSATPSAPESYIACGWDAQDFPADYHYRVWSLAPGASGPTSLYLSAITPATNDVVWCQVLGITVTMKVNGTTIATVTDTSGLTSGYPGLYYVDPNGGAPASNDVIWDTFAAGAGPALVSLTITPSSATATAGSYVQFTGIAAYADGTTANISNWSSSDTSVATVDATGSAYAANPGTVTITGTTGVDSGTANLTVAAAHGYTPLVNDSFVGPSGSYLGSNWTGCGYYGGAYTKLVYRDNHAGGDEAGGGGYNSQDCAVYTGYGAFPSDQYATATVEAPNPSGITQAGVQLRQSATPYSPESYIACGWNAQDFPADYHYRIWSLAPGAPGPASLYLSTVTPTTNDVIWCQVVGTTVTMTVNGTAIATATDTSGITNGYPGLYYVDPNAGAPTSTDIIWDKFVAGRIDGQNGNLTSQTITFTTNAPASAANNSMFTVAASASSGLAVAYTSSGACSNAGATYTMTSGTGTCSVIANQAGNANYAAAAQVTQTVNAGAASQTITFPAIPTQNGPGTVTLTATASSGLTVSYSVTSGPAMVSGNTLTTTGAGSVTVQATQAGNASYLAAPPVSQTFTVNANAGKLNGSNCNGQYTGTFTGNLTVSAGQTCIFTNGGVIGNLTEKGGSVVLSNNSFVKGNLQVNGGSLTISNSALTNGGVTGNLTQNGGTVVLSNNSFVTGNLQTNGGNLTVSNSSVGNDLQISGASSFSIGPGASIAGNLQIQSLPTSGGVNQVCGASVTHNLTFQNSGTALLIGSAGGCAGNSVGGDFTVQSNTAATTIDYNTIGGNLTDQNNTAATQVFTNAVTKTLQCNGNSSISGGGNTASSKQGQCAAF